MRISDWSSDVCSSDLDQQDAADGRDAPRPFVGHAKVLEEFGHSDHPCSVRAEPVEAPLFSSTGKEGQPFDKLRANGFWMMGMRIIRPSPKSDIACRAAITVRRQRTARPPPKAPIRTPATG